MSMQSDSRIETASTLVGARRPLAGLALSTATTRGLEENERCPGSVGGGPASPTMRPAGTHRLEPGIHVRRAGANGFERGLRRPGPGQRGAEAGRACAEPEPGPFAAGIALPRQGRVLCLLRIAVEHDYSSERPKISRKNRSLFSRKSLVRAKCSVSSY